MHNLFKGTSNWPRSINLSFMKSQFTSEILPPRDKSPLIDGYTTRCNFYDSTRKSFIRLGESTEYYKKEANKQLLFHCSAIWLLENYSSHHNSFVWSHIGAELLLNALTSNARKSETRSSILQRDDQFIYICDQLHVLCQMANQTFDTTEASKSNK